MVIDKIFFYQEISMLVFVEGKLYFRILVIMLKMTNKATSTRLSISFININITDNTKKCYYVNEK